MKFKLGEYNRQTCHNVAGIAKLVGLRKFRVRAAQGLMWSLSLSLTWGAAMPSTLAAQQVILRLGPLEQKLEIADLEEFAKTGELPQNLKLYAPILTPQVREALNRRLQIDPKLADNFIDDWLRSPRGKQLIESLGVAIPESTIPQIQAGLALAAQQANGLSLVSFLRAYPEENITIDASSLLAIALQFNSNYLQSQALGPLLERELAVGSNAPLPSFDPSVRGGETVQQQTLYFQDRQRHRTVPIDLYFPSDVQAQQDLIQTLRATSSLETRQVTSLLPLVVISHGLGANRKSFAYLARHLASHGFIVAALEHPDSNNVWLSNVSINRDASIVPATEFIERPKDISFVLDELAKLNQQKGLLQGKLNTRQVSLIGHSLGGYGALALVGAEVNIRELRQFCKSSTAISKAPADWLQCVATDLPEQKLQLGDERVKSAIALNPVIGQLFGTKGLSQVATPVLLLAGTEDTITPLLNHQLQPFTQLHSPKYLLTAVGGTHLSISAPVIDSTTKNSTFVKERQGKEADSLRRLLQGVSLAFIKQLTPEARIYAPFLTPAYAKSLSTPAMPLRLNTELPASITSLRVKSEK